jgi:hypothetical protein
MQELPINDFLRDDMLLKVTNSNTWYANIVNFMVAGYVSLGENRRKLQVKSKHHLWDDPYLYRVSSDGLLRRCVPMVEELQIIEKCHSAPYEGHYRVFRTQAKIWQCGFFWPTMYEDTKEFIRRCRKRQFQGNITARNPMPLHYNFQIEIFDVWGITSWDLSKSPKTVSTSWSPSTTYPSG